MPNPADLPTIAGDIMCWCYKDMNSWESTAVTRCLGSKLFE